MANLIAGSLPQWFLVVVSFLLGLAIGSYLNVVIYRLPRGESTVRPGSRCPACGDYIGPLDNLPIISFLLLRGRCRNCRASISPLYPTIEFLTGLVFALLIYLHGATWLTLAEMWLAAALIALISVDARHQLLPDRITFPTFLIAVLAPGLRASLSTSALDPHVALTFGDLGFSPSRAAILGAAILAGVIPLFWLLDLIDLILFNKYLDWEVEDEDAPAEVEDGEHRRYRRLLLVTSLIGVGLAVGWVLAVVFDSHRDPEIYQLMYEGLLEAIAGALIAAGPLWLLRALYFYLRGAEGLGLGDIKLMAVVGAFFGWTGAILTLLLGSVGGLILGIILARRGGAGLQTRLPLGVCLGAAALILLLAGPPMVRWYTGIDHL
jgi:prepilin signal peptidase PulO-like enzyme (type II secretory pathway)